MRPGDADQRGGSSSIPTETKNSTANASRIGSASDGRPQAVVGSPDDHAGQERAERHRDAEDQRRADGDAERDHEHRQREELARPRVRDVVEHARNDPRADDGREGDQRRHLEPR